MRNAVVVDASIALKWVIDESDSDKAQALLDDWIDKETVMLAPVLLAYEVANILYQNVRKGEITLDRAIEALEDVAQSGIEFDFSQDATLSIRAIQLAHNAGLKATYDPHYLALAERERCEFWTADTRMWKAVKDKFAKVRWIEDYHIARNDTLKE